MYIASQGRTEEEALANFREARELNFEPPVALTLVPRRQEIPVGTLRSILNQAHIETETWEKL